jgi:hypothetical protein
MVPIIDISRQPDANYYQCEQHNECQTIHDHAVLVIVLSTVEFEFNQAQYQ